MEYLCLKLLDKMNQNMRKNMLQRYLGIYFLKIHAELLEIKSYCHY